MQQSYKPYHVIIFIVSCLVLLGFVVKFAPEGRKNILGYEFRFLSQNKLLKTRKRHEVNLDSLVAEVDTTIIDIITDEEVDTIQAEPKKKRIIDYRISDDGLLTYNEQGQANFLQFFDELNSIGKNKLRILHYGDSQIEGDRVTSFLRQRLQTQFGGFGPGFIPAINVYNTISYVQNSSDNFVRYTNFGGKVLNSNRYGIMNSVGRFTPEVLDSINIDSLDIAKGWISIQPGTQTYNRTKKYTSITLHYCDAITTCKLNIYQNDELIRTDSLIADSGYHKYRFPITEESGEIKFEFESRVSPSILGFSLDGDYGLQVDNIAMRGSSGTFFGKIDQSLAKTIYDEQNVGLFIMQFGGNSIPYIKDSLGVQRAVSYFKGQLNTIKRLRPNAMILVVGPSDMSTLIEEEYMTYPLLPYFVDRLKKATLSVGAAYYDMYRAMGGEDSMVAWVENGLAAEDYIHFSPKGARIAAQKFYDSFMTVYNLLMEEYD